MAVASKFSTAYIRTRRLVGCGFPQPPGREQPFVRSVKNMGNRLYVGNLSFDADKDTVRQAFAQVGAVTDVHVVMDRDSGRSRGFAFVTMATAALAAEAISRLNGTEIDGRALRVNEATERPGR